jgi:signal transduction histidine kinase
MLLSACDDLIGEDSAQQRLENGRALRVAAPPPLLSDSITAREADDWTWLVWKLSAPRAARQLLLVGCDRESDRDHRARVQPEQREMLAQLIHELRGPLAPMRAAVDLLETGEPRIVERVRAVLDRQVEMMSRLLHDLHELARGERAELALVRQCTDVNALVEQAVELARPALNARGHRLSVDVERGLWIDADAGRVVQVMANLLTNAAKYTDAEGRISLSARIDHDQLVVCVRDNGIGIAADALPHVFDAFVRTSRARRRGQDGFGLGLSVVRAIVLQHGGSVEAHSDGPDRGSQFTVRLPAAPRKFDGECSKRFEPAST